MNKRFAYTYYFVIILIMALWDGIGVVVPMAFRMMFLAMTFAPLIKWKELFPAVFVSTVTISFNAFTSPLLPTSISFYIIILLGFAFFSSIRKMVLPSIIFIIVFVLMTVVDIITQGGFARPTTRVAMCLLAFVIIMGDGEKSNEHMPYAFMIIAIVLSYWSIFRPEARMQAAHAVEGFEEVGVWTDPNYIGCMIALGAVVAINELMLRKKTLLKTIFSTITLLLSIFALAYLASRGAIITLMAGTIVLVLFDNKAKMLKKLLFMMLMASFLVFMYKSSYFDLAIARFQDESMVTGTSRTIIWQQKLDAFFNEGSLMNWLFGFGHIGGFEIGHFGQARAFHNDFVAALVEYGFVGLILFIYTFYYAIKCSPKSSRLTVCALLAAYVAVGMTLEPTFSDMPSSIVFTFFLFYILMFSTTKEVTE